MSRVIFFSHKKIFEKGKTSAADIRFWEMAKVLAKKGHKITIAEKPREHEETIYSIKFIGWKKVLSSSLFGSYDVAIIPLWTTEKDVLEKVKNIPVVVDAYAPIVLEQASIYANRSPNAREVSDFTNYVLTSSNVLLSMADFVMCAGNRQKQYYSGIMSALGRINPLSYNENLVGSVPSGIPSKKPIHKKDIFKRIVGKNKKIVLWPSSIFPWFDAETAIKAIKIVSKKEKNVVLVFLGATGSSEGSLGYEGAENAKKVADKEGILDKNVFFIDRIPYEEMESAYLESEIALITYPHGFETEFALRTRTIHCMWAGLPVICSEGDELAETIKKEEAGLVVKAKEPKLLARSILELLSNSRLRSEIAKKGQMYSSKNFRWENVCSPLEKFCRKPEISESKNILTPYSIIDEKNEIIRHLQEYLEDYKSRDKKSNQAILKNETEIEKEQKIIEEQSQEIKKINKKSEHTIQEQIKEIKKRDTHIIDLEIELQKKERVIRQQREEMQRKEQIIQQQREEIKKREGNIRSLNGELQKKEQEIQEHKEEIEKREAKLQILENEIFRIKNQIREILNSRGYKIASKIDRLGRAIGIIKNKKR
jgi:glycosyltransferase involved in cell wall biosynthesis